MSRGPMSRSQGSLDESDLLMQKDMLQLTSTSQPLELSDFTREPFYLSKEVSCCTVKYREGGVGVASPNCNRCWELAHDWDATNTQ